jgi:hypothetical protein
MKKDKLIIFCPKCNWKDKFLSPSKKEIFKKQEMGE